MRTKLTTLQWLLGTLAELNDDPTRPWSDYPCIKWPFSCNPKGYGRLGIGQDVVLAHRHSLIVTIGDIGDRLSCHHCDCPPCIRPVHLFPSSPKGNSEDMVKKGRSNKGKSLGHINVGSAHGMSILNDALVYQARLDLLTGSKTRREIAASLNMSIGGATAMLRGTNWKHVPMPVLAP